jgi:hypothetical protein
MAQLSHLPLHVQVKHIVSHENPFLAVTPDGMVNCDCHGTCVLSIKCPDTYRDKKLEDMVQDPMSCLTRHSIPQILCPGTATYDCTGASFCDFLVWVSSGAKLCNVVHDLTVMRENIPKLEEF